MVQTFSISPQAEVNKDFVLYFDMMMNLLLRWYGFTIYDNGSWLIHTMNSVFNDVLDTEIEIRGPISTRWDLALKAEYKIWYRNCYLNLIKLVYIT